MIRTRAPVRISFGGGGTDVSPYTEKFGGAAINAAINRYAYATFIERPDNRIILSSFDLNKNVEYGNISEIQLDGELDMIKCIILYFRETQPHFFRNHKKGFEIHTSCEIEPRSGLGSSASMFASVAGLFNMLGKEYRIDHYEMAELIYFLERKKLKNFGGRQDQYATIFGGINFMEFKGNNFVRVNPIKLKEDNLLELESNLLLLNIGQRTDSGDIIEDQVKNVELDNEAMQATHKTRELAYEIKYTLIRGDFLQFGKLLDLAWREKKKFSKKISSGKIDMIYEELKNAGAIGGKIVGAGGGGHMLFYCTPGKKLHILKKALELGVKEVPFVFDHQGLTSWYVDYNFPHLYERNHQRPDQKKHHGKRIVVG